MPASLAQSPNFESGRTSADGPNTTVTRARNGSKLALGESAPAPNQWSRLLPRTRANGAETAGGAPLGPHACEANSQERNSCIRS